MDFATAGLLDGLDGDAREARNQLLRQLAAEGVSLEEMKAAIAEDRLALLPVERVLGGRYTAREIEGKTGVPAALMVRISRLLGLPEPDPDDRVFGDEDIEAAQAAKMFLDIGFGEDAIVEITGFSARGWRDWPRPPPPPSSKRSYGPGTASMRWRRGSRSWPSSSRRR